MPAEQPHPAPIPNYSDATVGGGLSGERWYVVHTQPHAEGRALFHLERQGYRVFCPRYRKVIRHARKKTNALMPLFANYLFLRLDVSREQWRA